MTRRFTAVATEGEGHKTTQNWCMLATEIKKDNARQLKLLLEKTPELIEERDDLGCTILHEAVSRNKFETAKMLITEHHSLIYAVDNNGLTALRLAIPHLYQTISGERKEMIKLLLLHKPEVIETRDGRHAVRRLIVEDHGDTVELLIQARPELLESIVSDGKSIFQIAVENNSRETIKWLLKTKPELIDTIAANGRNMLSIAMETDRRETIKLLVRAKPEWTDEVEKVRLLHQENWKALQEVIKEGNVRRMSTLVSTNPSMFDEDIDTNALYFAAQNNQAEIVELLLKYKRELLDNTRIDRWNLIYFFGEDVAEDIIELLLLHKPELIDESRDDYGKNILHYAAEAGYEKVVGLLLKIQPELAGSIADYSCKDVLQYAVESGSKGIVELVLALEPKLIDRINDSDMNCEKYILHLAASADKNEEIIKLLLEAKPSLISEIDLKGKTALHHAACDGNRKMIECLVQHNTELTKLVDNYGQIPLQYAAARGDEEVIEFLLEADPTSINFIDKSGKTILHSAALQPNAHILVLLLRHNLELIDARDNEGSTALHEAAQGSNNEVIEYLLRIRPDLINVANNDGKSALDQAIIREKDETVKLLLELKPELVNENEASGQLAFCLAARKGNEQLIELLLGLRPELIDSVYGKEGKTALYMAVEQRRYDVVKLLLTCKPELIDTNREDRQITIFRALEDTGLLEFLLKLRPELIDAVNAEGRPLIHAAVDYRCEQAVRMLINIKPELIDNIYAGMNLLHNVAHRGQEEMFKLLHTTKPESINFVNEEGKNILHCAVQGSNPNIVESVLELKPELVDLADKKGSTPLNSFYRLNDEKMLALLLSESSQIFEDILAVFVEKKSDSAWNQPVIAGLLVGEYCNPLLTFLNQDMIDIIYEYIVDSNIIKPNAISKIYQDAAWSGRSIKGSILNIKKSKLSKEEAVGSNKRIHEDTATSNKRQKSDDTNKEHQNTTLYEDLIPTTVSSKRVKLDVDLTGKDQKITPPEDIIMINGHLQITEVLGEVDVHCN